MQLIEISDLVVDHSPGTHDRLPVRRDEVVARLTAAGDRRGARIAAGLACDADGVLDPAAVDRRLVAVHTELQRLSEELRLGERIADLLRPLLAVIRAADPAAGRLRVVDVGCGLGHLVRWLAASGALGPDVDLLGVDFNAALVTEADRLARDEGLDCRFVQGDAFALGPAAEVVSAPRRAGAPGERPGTPGPSKGPSDPQAVAEPTTVYVSTGVLHHFRGPDLEAFFAAQATPGTAAFCHFDIAATSLAPVGAWIFHRARMRDPLGRHDGVVSARRAHDDETLLSAAAHAEGMVPLVYEPRGRSSPFCTTIRPVVGLRPALLPPLRAALGAAASSRLVGAPDKSLAGGAR
ncbi:class I SAM-dependent methyltransferase [Streptomyces sp. NBC_01304]|uniref:class I SAM-dependent methyltransferase n=1 Tax=Streptomyces sp. NBC_01304 TaxID=2903818 RepID=UPI002E0DD810|nr:class I SAM-dependent methyltransferase [Streptomyces sp. NBC_01304]